MKSTTKDAFYFPHDSNAKDDIKCVELIGDLGLEGYGVYWVLIETLREQPDYTYPVKLLPALARRFGSEPGMFQKVVRDYELFVVEDEKIFFSVSLKRRMQLYEHKKEQAREAGKKSAEKRAKSTSVQQTGNDRSTTDEPKRVNNSRVNNIKSNESTGRFFPPTLPEISDFITKNSMVVNADRFYRYYTSKKWAGVTDWMAKLWDWNDDDLKKQPPAGVTLGCGERIENGRRTYGTGKYTVPMDAPRRPSESSAWSSSEGKWVYL